MFHFSNWAATFCFDIRVDYNTKERIKKFTVRNLNIIENFDSESKIDFFRRREFRRCEIYKKI